ncbi:hypothetical protein TM48_03764 [Mycobacterium shottsii]|nr:hypothetical protein TM48_03764 [Mycobacterium shottsii]
MQWPGARARAQQRRMHFRRRSHPNRGCHQSPPGTTRRHISTPNAGPVIRSSNAGATACSSDTRPPPHRLVLKWSSPSNPNRSSGAAGDIILIASSLGQCHQFLCFATLFMRHATPPQAHQRIHYAPAKYFSLLHRSAASSKASRRCRVWMLPMLSGAGQSPSRVNAIHSCHFHKSCIAPVQVVVARSGSGESPLGSTAHS